MPILALQFVYLCHLYIHLYIYIYKQLGQRESCEYKFRVYIYVGYDEKRGLTVCNSFFLEHMVYLKEKAR